MTLNHETLVRYRIWLQRMRGKNVAIQFWDAQGRRGRISTLDELPDISGDLSAAIKFQVGVEPQVTRSHFEQVVEAWAKSLTGKRPPD
jgi:hypothetical protein